MFKAFGFAATMHQESWFMCDFMCHMKSCTECPMALQTLTQSLSQEHVIPFAQTPLLFLCVFSFRIGVIYSAAFFSPLHHQHPIYSHPLPVHLPLTRGQVCPCVASSNRKCIMDVTFLSISTTKSHTPLCSQ